MYCIFPRLCITIQMLTQCKSLRAYDAIACHIEIRESFMLGTIACVSDKCLNSHLFILEEPFSLTVLNFLQCINAKNAKKD